MNYKIYLKNCALISINLFYSVLVNNVIGIESKCINVSPSTRLSSLLLPFKNELNQSTNEVFIDSEKTLILRVEVALLCVAFV